MKTMKCKVKFSEVGCFGGNVFPPRQTASGIIYIYIYISKFGGCKRIDSSAERAKIFEVEAKRRGTGNLEIRDRVSASRVHGACVARALSPTRNAKSMKRQLVLSSNVFTNMSVTRPLARNHHFCNTSAVKRLKSTN